MQVLRPIRILVISTFVALIGAGIVVGVVDQPGRFGGSETLNEPAAQKHRGIHSRAEIIGLALAKNDLFDCATHRTGGKPLLPVQREIFTVVQNVRVTPDDGNGYHKAVWSPSGDALVFIGSTNEYREIPNQSFSSNTQTRLVQLGINPSVVSKR
ncbi:MAG: hypothetical protein HY868_03980 [Chloroflexi bacterium]|nr:hypothetical protein [Chloroflexota bacterium]